MYGVSGSVNLGSRPFSKDMKRTFAYILQEDIYFPSVTVTIREAFEFTAALRLSNQLSADERSARVQAVIKTLHFSVTTANQSIMLASGGEKRRTSIGVELLANPKVLLGDEITSGTSACLGCGMPHAYVLPSDADSR
jgi:ABC-type multidrug transport system ATPase subunit